MPRLGAFARKGRQAARLRPTIEGLEARALLARAGYLDPTFGGGTGYALTSIVPFSTTTLTNYVSAVVEPDGSTLIDGEVGVLDHTFGVLHLKPDGSTDTSFGNAGVAAVALPAGIDSIGITPTAQPSTILLQPDGKIVVVDVAQMGVAAPKAVTIVARFDAHGRPDPTFGIDGVAALDQALFGTLGASMPYAAIQHDGKIVMAGSSLLGKFDSSYQSAQIASVRLTTTGQLDSTFGTGGLVTISDATTTQLGPPFPANETATGLAIQPDGKLVILALLSDFNHDMSIPELIRLDADGSRDASLSQAGLAASGIFSTDENGLIVQPDGEILVLGQADHTQSNPANPFPVILARLDEDGVFEEELSFEGTTASGFFAVPNSFALEPNGKIFLAGSDTDGRADFVAFRVTADLALDPSFGLGGVSVPTFSVSTAYQGGNGNFLVAQAVAVGANGQEFVLGSSGEMRWLIGRPTDRPMSIVSSGSPGRVSPSR